MRALLGAAIKQDLGVTVSIGLYWYYGSALAIVAG
jgi:hypothetical protein